MDIDNETDDHMHQSCVNNILMERISMSKILEDLKSFKVVQNLRAFEKYIAALMEENYEMVESEDVNYAKHLDDCIQCVTTYIFDLTVGDVDEKIMFRKILFLLSVKKLNVLLEGELESCDLLFSMINNGCILIKLCIDNNSCFMVDYFICQILKELDILEKVYDKTHVSNKYIFHKRAQIGMYSVEKKMKDGKIEDAFMELQKQKEFVIELKPYQEYFVSLCYNVSLQYKHEENYCNALNVLLLACDVCKVAECLPKNMKMVLHYLVCLCLKYNTNENWQHGIDALDLAYRNEIDMFFVIGKLKLSLIAKQQRYLEEVLNQASEWKEIKVEDICAIAGLLRENELSIRAAEFIRSVRCNFFPNSDKFFLMKLEIQIYISENDRRAYTLLENSIEMIKKSDVSKTLIESLYKLIASHAGIKFKEKMFKDSLTWYNYCAELYEVADLDPSLSHYAQTRMCLCYLEMNEWKLAKQCFVKLKLGSFGKDPLHIYLSLQIAFMSDDEKLADETLNKYIDDGDKIGDILLSCCQRAFLTGKKDVLFKILEALLLKYQTPEGSVLSAKLSQCLIGLGGDEDVQKKYILYMDKALDILEKNPLHPETTELSQWFSRVAWNLALTPDIAAKYMFEFFLRCCCFCEISLRNLNRLKNALMLAAASGLHVARQLNIKENSELSEKQTILGKVMTIIEKCKSLETGSNINLLRLLYLYEFETKCHTEKLYEGSESLNEILNLPFMDVKTLEHIAAIVHEFAPHNYEIIKESLKKAVQKIAESQDERSPEASKTFHSLIQVLFYVQEYLSSSAEEENLQLCNHLLKLIETKALKNYSQLEILWVMAKCWNWGILKLTRNDSKRANKWCSLAMAFLQNLDSLKTMHEKKLNDMFSAYFPESTSEKEQPAYLEQ